MRLESETEFASEEKRARDLGKVLDSLWGADRALVASQSSREVVSTKGFDHGGREEVQ